MAAGMGVGSKGWPEHLPGRRIEIRLDARLSRWHEAWGTLSLERYMRPSRLAPFHTVVLAATLLQATGCGVRRADRTGSGAGRPIVRGHQRPAG